MTYMELVKTVDPKSSHHKEKVFSFLFLYMHEIVDVKLNLLW